MGEDLIVDAANVIGSVPDGWWRDRAGATRGLRDALSAAAARAGTAGPTTITMVVEGRARTVEAITGVRVVAAPGSGDDAIVGLVDAAGGACTVVTADRALRERVTALGARVMGPGALRDWLQGRQGDIMPTVRDTSTVRWRGRRRP